jgi:hypothetical protein
MPKRKPTLYNRILKQFTVINNKLPEDRKLSITERRKIIRESLLPQFKNIPAYKLRVKQIKGSIIHAYETLPPKESCDLNYISPDNLTCNWFEIDEFIKERVPDCIYIRVNAGQFGVTKIFNTRDYNYYSNGVQDITEQIRPIAENPNKKMRVYPNYAGVIKVRPRKRNDGTPENYFLDMILYINETPLADDTTEKFQLPKTKEVRETKKKVRNLLDEKFKKLKQRKARKKRARKTITKNLQLYKQRKKRLERSNAPMRKTKEAFLKQYNKTAMLAQKQYELGLITKDRYKQILEELNKRFKDGGEI